jgi:hypothetical protein
MSKRPGRKKELYKKKDELSSDAKILKALTKKQPQNREELIKNASIFSVPTFYRSTSRLIENEMIKRVDDMYALTEYNPLKWEIEKAFIKNMRGKSGDRPVYQQDLVDETGQPWPKIESLAYEIAKKLKLSIFTDPDGKVYFVKTYQPPKDEST